MLAEQKSRTALSIARRGCAPAIGGVLAQGAAREFPGDPEEREAFPGEE